MTNSYCTACGKALFPGSNFCGLCGAPVSAGASIPSPTQQQSVFTQQQQTAPAQQQQPAPAQQQPVLAQQPPSPQPVQQATQAQTQYIPQQPAYPQSYAQPPQHAPAMSAKQSVLANAPGVLNRPDRPWAVTVEGDSIVARWKWMDATFFAPHEISDATRQFTFTVTLTDNGTWKELDKTENKKSGVKMSGGKLSFGSSSNSFMGKTNQKSFQLGMGKNNQTGEVGVIGFKFNTTDVKQPVREYLISCGWKQAALFG